MTPLVLIADIDKAVIDVTTVVVKINKIDSAKNENNQYVFFLLKKKKENISYLLLLGRQPKTNAKRA